MTGDKTQPQRLLEEVDSTIQHTESEQYPTDPPEIVDAPKFPTIQEQNEYWRKKEAFEKLEAEKAQYKANEATRPPRKWSLARRRKFNATHAKKKLVEHPVYDYPPTGEQLTAQEAGADTSFLPVLWPEHREVAVVIDELKKLFGAILICLICLFYYALGVLIPAAFFIGIFGGGK